MNVCDVIELSKFFKCIKYQKNQTVLPQLDLNSIKLITSADGNFNNLPNGGS